MVADAGDWPPKSVLFEALYLLYLGSKPITGKSFWSVYIHTLSHTVQWTWIVAGTDLTGSGMSGVVGRSRGDRYRTNLSIRQELLRATYPWFAQKQGWTVTGTTPSGLALQGTPVTPTEYFWWTSPTFLNRIDKTSGVVYGAATMDIVAMEPPMPSDLDTDSLA